MADVAVVLLDGEGEVFSGKELVFGDQPVIALPIIGGKGLAFQSDFVDEFLA